MVHQHQQPAEVAGGGEAAPMDLKSALASAHLKYMARNPRSQEAFNSSLPHLPGSNTRTVLHALPFPLTFAGGESCYLQSLDSQSYIDFLGDYTVGIYGHSNIVIKNAVVEALERGWNLGGNNMFEKALAKIVVERFKSGMDMVRFCNSGTEANLMSIGTAINFTGRTKIVVFDSGYHGSVFSFGANTKMNAQNDFVLASYNDIEGTRSILSALPDDSVAAILVEPMQGSGGCIPGNPDFLAFLRETATSLGAILIFDEVMTSRLSYGGLQLKFGIKPDMTTLGKWVGGGMSFGAFGGRRDIMEMFDPRSGKLMHSGTFNNNVVTMAAGIAGCGILTEERLFKLNGLGDELRDKLNAVIVKHVPGERVGEKKMFVRGIGSLNNVCFTGEEKDTLQALFYHHMLENGLYLAARGFIALSIELTVEHVDVFVKATESFVVRYQAVLR